jgi:hypothetical protein
VLSIVNIFALLAQKTAQKKRNSGVCCVFTQIFLRGSAKTGSDSAIFRLSIWGRLKAV